MLPALKLSLGDPIFIGDFFGMLLALPIALFLAYWLSDVKKKSSVIIGAFIGIVVGFIGILCWVDTLIHPSPLPGANGLATFFGSIFICSVLGLTGAIITDLVVATRNQRDYRRQIEHE